MKAKWEAKGQTVPALFWVDPYSLDQGCQNQIRRLMSLPFAVHHVAVMPDAHCGYGMPIGTVLATSGVVIPNAVGVDIGCGMIVAKIFGVTTDEVRPHLEDLQHEIKQRIPVGRNWRSHSCDAKEMPERDIGAVVFDQHAKARKQLGTLGGGNHFIEIQTDTEGQVWAMIHSGSRNLGKQVCDFYNKWAKEDNQHNHSVVPPSADLGFFDRKHEGFAKYMAEMEYCVEFARNNRAKMMLDVLQSFQDIWGDSRVAWGHVHDICHNHAAWEHHMGKNVLVHRKGAAGPYRGNMGIIPGSMGSESYIVSHRGVRASFMSTSHGAGRTMSRKQAKIELDLETEQAKLDEMGVVHDLRGVKNLDEATGAYKDIESVMADQNDLCRVEVELTPMLSIKG